MIWATDILPQISWELLLFSKDRFTFKTCFLSKRWSDLKSNIQLHLARKELLKSWNYFLLEFNILNHHIKPLVLEIQWSVLFKDHKAEERNTSRTQEIHFTYSSLREDFLLTSKIKVFENISRVLSFQSKLSSHKTDVNNLNQ